MPLLLEKEMATHSSVLAWRIPGRGSLVGCRVWGCTELDTSEVTQQCPYQSLLCHIDAAYDCSMYYQLSNLFCLCTGQQATTCSASSTKICKTIADHGKPQMDMATKTLRPETSKRGRPNDPRCPSSVGSSQKEPHTPIPKELGLPSFEGGMLGSQNRKKESRMAVAKRQGREKPTKIEQRKVQRPE